MKKGFSPTDSELEILQVLWQNGPSTVREVHEVLTESKDAGYTTTLKIMQIMAEKGIAERDTSNRTHIYSAVVSKTDTQRSMLQTFIANTFGGSTSSLVLQALGDHNTNDQELKEIKSLIEKLENKKS